MELDFLEYKILENLELKNPSVFLSEDHSSDKNFDKEFNKSFKRVKDFIKIAKKDGSGNYPEDFDYLGYTRDDGSITHSRSPKDWGIDDSYEFAQYKDITKRKESGLQMASWLEYDYRVNGRRSVTIDSTDNTLNASGIKWFREYCSDNNLRIDNVNSVEMRNDLRKFVSSVKV